MRVRCSCGSVGLVTLVLLTAGASACRSGSDAPPEFRIGLLALLDGVPRTTSGLPSIEGAELAVAEANETGGLVIDEIPHRAVLIVREYEDRPDSATSVARALINQERIDALIGPQFSRHAIPVSVVAENARIPMVSPMSSNPRTTAGKRFVFRLAFLDDFQAEVMARFAFDELSSRRAAILYDISTAYGRQLAKVFCDTFEELGGQMVAIESYARDEPRDYAEELERIRESEAEVLYLPNDTEYVRAQIIQARALGIDATLLGGDTWDMEAFKLMPECDGAFVAHQWHHELDTPEARRFVERYRKEHGANPKVTVAMTYDAVRLLLDVVRETGSKSPEAIRDGLWSPRTFTGATGTIVYGEGPDPTRSVFVSRIENGASTLHRMVDP